MQLSMAFPDTGVCVFTSIHCFARRCCYFCCRAHRPAADPTLVNMVLRSTNFNAEQAKEKLREMGMRERVNVADDDGVPFFTRQNAVIVDHGRDLLESEARRLKERERAELSGANRLDQELLEAKKQHVFNILADNREVRRRQDAARARLGGDQRV